MMTAHVFPHRLIRMVTHCEVCEEDSTHVCSGLDVPALYFCEPHALGHEQTCPDVKAGRSWVLKVEGRSK